MQRQVREGLPQRRAESQILDDERVHPDRIQKAGIGKRLRQFRIREQRVQRHVGAHAPEVPEIHRLFQRLLIEILGTHARVKARAAQVYGVRTALHGGDVLRRTAGRCQ